MNLEILFSIVSGLAATSWITLILFSHSPKVRKFLKYIVVVFLFGGLYSGLISIGLQNSEGNFSTLKSVKLLFQNDYALLAGWVHYLAFDLFIGIWETEDAREMGINRWIMILPLFLTFYFGPMGLLIYFVMRTIKQRY
ncbi:ABA4-like family protein [Leptospira sp. 96542]|nr:ABA4-like family protein [Leptospira sp. 96542]